MKNIGYIYRITIKDESHELNNHFYIGRRGSEKNPRDFWKDVHYFGSPKNNNLFFLYKKEYGTNKLHKELIGFSYSNLDLVDFELHELEKCFKINKMCMNMHNGKNSYFTLGRKSSYAELIRRSIISKEIHNRPEVKEQYSKFMKEYANRPEVKNFVSQTQKLSYINNPSRKTYMSKIMIDIWKDDTYRDYCRLKMIEAQYRPEIKQLKKERMLGENNPQYGNVGELSPNFGKIWTASHHENFSNAVRGEKHHNFNKPAFNSVEIKYPQLYEKILNYIELYPTFSAAKIYEMLGENLPFKSNVVCDIKRRINSKNN